MIVVVIVVFRDLMATFVFEVDSVINAFIKPAFCKKCGFVLIISYAPVAELVYAHVLGTCLARGRGSSPLGSTRNKRLHFMQSFVYY